MPRPASIVKNELSAAIIELRQYLGYSQQSWANLLGLSIGAVARWELNQRPDRPILKRLIELAMKHGVGDAEEVLYREYQREFGLSLESPFARHADLTLQAAIDLISHDPAGAKRVLQGLRRRIKREFPGTPAVVQIKPKDKK